MNGIYDLLERMGEPPWMKKMNQMDKMSGILNSAYTGLSAFTRNLDYMSSKLENLQLAYKALQIPQIMESNSFLLQREQLLSHIQPPEMFLSYADKLSGNNILNSIHFDAGIINHSFALNDFTKINRVLDSYSKPLDSISYFHSVYNSAFGFEGIYSEQYAELYRSIPSSSKLKFRDKKIQDSEQFFVRNENGYEYSLSQQKDVVGGCQLFHDIEEKDIIEFINFLSSNPYRALEHPVGRKIAEEIKKFKQQLISNIKPQFVFYRSIAIEENASPFLLKELFNPAPPSNMKQGRFNHGRRPCLYVSDDVDTSKSELKNNKKVCTGKAMLKKEIKILDMSDKNNIVFEYCLKENDENGFVFPRAYFFPSFIANLCVANGVDGIKYKSTISNGYCYVLFDLHSDSFEALELV